MQPAISVSKPSFKASVALGRIQMWKVVHLLRYLPTSFGDFPRSKDLTGQNCLSSMFYHQCELHPGLYTGIGRHMHLQLTISSICIGRPCTCVQHLTDQIYDILQHLNLQGLECKPTFPRLEHLNAHMSRCIHEICVEISIGLSTSCHDSRGLGVSTGSSSMLCQCS